MNTEEKHDFVQMHKDLQEWLEKYELGLCETKNKDGKEVWEIYRFVCDKETLPEVHRWIYEEYVNK